MGENEKIKSNLQVVIHRSIKDWRERFLYLLAPGVIFLCFFVFAPGVRCLLRILISNGRFFEIPWTS